MLHSILLRLEEREVVDEDLPLVTQDFDGSHIELPLIIRRARFIQEAVPAATFSRESMSYGRCNECCTFILALNGWLLSAELDVFAATLDKMFL